MLYHAHVYNGVVGLTAEDGVLLRLVVSRLLITFESFWLLHHTIFCFPLVLFLSSNKNLFYLACAMAVGAVGMGIVNLTAGDGAILGYAVTISAILCGLGFLWLPRLLAMCNFYMFLQEVRVDFGLKVYPEPLILCSYHSLPPAACHCLTAYQ